MANDRPPVTARLDALLNDASSVKTPKTSPRPSPPGTPPTRPPPLVQPTAMPSPRAVPEWKSATAPLLRWLGSSSRPDSLPPSRAPSQPPSPALSSLSEALREPCITQPPPVHIPSSFAHRGQCHPPSLLQNLTRSTLPTSSFNAESCSVQLSSSSPPPTSMSLFQRRHESRSSIDTLRSLSLDGSRRSFSSAPSSPVPSEQDRFSSAWWWWTSSEDKQNVDQLLAEDDQADSAEQEQSNIRRKYRSPKNPVVFCHGLLGFDSVTIGPSIAPLQVAHWRGFKHVLEANGTEVLMTRVPATSSPVERAKVLEKTISEVYPGRSVHLIGHSMGGLDCRYLTTHLTQRTFKVLSVTTVATPHHGSSFADHFLSTVGLERLPSVLYLLDMLPNGGGDGKAFESLTVAAMKKFNEETPDVPGVRYFSWGAKYEPGLIDTWKWPHGVILEKEGPNDGLVSVESSKWGTYLGTLTGVNHLDLVGWINTARYKWAEFTGRQIKFKPATFYLGIVDMLARDVEGQGPREDEGHSEVQAKAGEGVNIEEDRRRSDSPSNDAGGNDHHHDDDPHTRRTRSG